MLGDRDGLERSCDLIGTRRPLTETREAPPGAAFRSGQPGFRVRILNYERSTGHSQVSSSANRQGEAQETGRVNEC
jgi:hypothetical protein